MIMRAGEYTKYMLRMVADLIEAEPNRYNQGMYVLNDAWDHIPRTIMDCNTRCCIAGWVALLDLQDDIEARLTQERAKHECIFTQADFKSAFSMEQIANDVVKARYANTNRQDFFHVENHAALILGLTDDEANILFDADWKPVPGMTVPEALRALADGASVVDITDGVFLVSHGHDPVSEWPVAYEHVD